MHKTKTFTLKKLVLALAIAGYTMGSAYAVLTSPTGTIQGTAPALSAPSFPGSPHTVDLSSSATGTALATGDTITLTYDYTDADGDADASTTQVHWYYVNGVVETEVVAGIVNIPATGGASGTSVMTLPGAAIGADRIKVVIQEYSATGVPRVGQTITIDDTSVSGPENPGIPTPPGPVAPGTGPNAGVTPGIYLASDTSFSTNLIGSSTPLNVGDSYVFRLTDDATSADLTGSVTYNWRLLGTSATTGTSAPAGGFVTSVTDGNFTVPTNTQPDGTPLTGSADGAQGFSLAVDYN